MAKNEDDDSRAATAVLEYRGRSLLGLDAGWTLTQGDGTKRRMPSFLVQIRDALGSKECTCTVTPGESVCLRCHAIAEVEDFLATWQDIEQILRDHEAMQKMPRFLKWIRDVLCMQDCTCDEMKSGGPCNRCHARDEIDEFLSAAKEPTP